MVSIFVQPRSSKNIIVGQHKNELKIKLTAPPIGGAANKMCIHFLAKCLKIPKSTIEIISGHTGRSKKLLIHLPSEQSKYKRRLHIIELLSSYAKQKP
ncbi:MAG: DUF167 domain-containing protein [Desulfobacterales bacterium]